MTLEEITQMVSMLFQNLNQISFHGVFRDYQQKVLDHAEKHMKDKKIHIVAAPGSGKTILGLELIRRLGHPALILSPSVTIRQQWGERFESNFLQETENIKEYLSFDLKSPRFITSVTYQALYAAYNKTTLQNSESEEELEDETTESFSDFDLIKTIKQAGIRTICLDEAHHLHSEWQKALESFLDLMAKDVTVIALTATPPYDGTPAEWKRYTSLCGEIDEEIFVPQLVAQKTLCPHQDYIYFNYPAEKEIEILKAYKTKALSCTDEILHGGMLGEILQAVGGLETHRGKEELILENAKQFIALFCLARCSGIEIPRKLVKMVSPSGKLPLFKISYAETAFQFVIDSPEIFGADISEQLRTKLAQNTLIEKRKVCLATNEKINRLLVSSIGKLHSINEIVCFESGQLGNDLRMLILTDHIKKDMIKIVGTKEPIDAIGTVPIFESVRRAVDGRVSIALLSGTLVILPNAILEPVLELARQEQISCSCRELRDVQYSIVMFSGSNKNKVHVITEAFQQGYIQILIGTKALLGEGWDSPCINSLILASFVGSFMLSNQMRGRAIRVDRNNPDKVSNIWHLVTVEPPMIHEKGLPSLLTKFTENDSTFISNDFDMLERRFSGFLAPAYHRDAIESGIERLDVIRPPFNKAGIDRINKEMLELAGAREEMAKRWERTFGSGGHSDIIELNEISPKVQPKGFLFRNLLGETIFLLIFYKVMEIVPQIIFADASSVFRFLINLGLVMFFGYFLLIGAARIFRYLTPEHTVKTLAGCVLNTLKEIGEIESKEAKLKVKADVIGFNIYCTLSEATNYEKSIFAKAIKEMLSAIDNPRYILIKRMKFLWFSLKKYNHSYACPSIIDRKKEYVEVLVRYLQKSSGGFDLFYTRNENGRKKLLKCRRKSYMNANDAVVKGRRVTKWE
jgi:superfamily II DNA or RNA helicase